MFNNAWNKLRIEVTDFNNETQWTEYTKFRVLASDSMIELGLGDWPQATGPAGKFSSRGHGGRWIIMENQGVWVKV